MTERIELKREGREFAKGGNRRCFAHPDDLAKCIKVAREDRTAGIRKQLAPFPYNLRPTSYYDENWQERKAFLAIEKTVGTAAFELVPRYYGLIETDLGTGLCSELIRDSDNRISITLKQYIWQFGVTNRLSLKLEKFKDLWWNLGMPSRNLLLHNIVVQQRDDEIHRIVVIDGLGWPSFPTVIANIPLLARYKAGRKVTRMEHMVTALLGRRLSGGDWGHHGWMEESARNTM
jgi:hypothetical protein